jgi:predicted DNA-binding transcriptional regulator AlpA
MTTPDACAHARLTGQLGGGRTKLHGTIDVMSAADELMTVEQVLAELCGVSRRTFYRWRELGKAPRGIKLPNGEIRIWRSDFTTCVSGHEEIPLGGHHPSDRAQ